MQASTLSPELLSDPQARRDVEELAAMPVTGFCATLLSWLDGQDARHAELARCFIARAGKLAADWLIGDASAPRKSPAHRVRALRALELVADQLDEDGWFALMNLQRRGGAVAQAATRVMVASQVARDAQRPPSPSPALPAGAAGGIGR